MKSDKCYKQILNFLTPKYIRIVSPLNDSLVLKCIQTINDKIVKKYTKNNNIKRQIF